MLDLSVSVFIIALCAALWTAEHFLWLAYDALYRVWHWANAEQDAAPVVEPTVKARRKRKLS